MNVLSLLLVSAALAPAADLSPGAAAGDRRVIDLKGQQVALRWCPPGTFTMGSPVGEPERKTDEVQHQVTLTNGYWLMETELTQAQQAAVGQVGRPKFKGETRPAERVTWYDAVELANLVSVASGLTPAYVIDKTTQDPDTDPKINYDDKRWTVTLAPGSNGFRLPTEAQWEYACRAGTTTIFSFGDAIDSTKANFNGRSSYNRAPASPWAEKTLPVGSFAPNPWGFLDIHGNVWEWCWDRYNAYPEGAVTDPPGPATGPHRVLRGGTWEYKGAYLRCAARIHYTPAKNWDLIGVRLAVPATIPTK